ncbi:MAG: M56 family metallopeptidase [Flavobacteriaceae bacterium]
MLHFILQTIAFQLFFLIIYDVFLKKETFFNWNRAYLLLTAILSVALPFIKIQSFKNVVPKEFVLTLPEVTIGNVQNIDTNQAVEIVATESSKFQWSWESVFYLGALIALFIFIVKLFKIATLIYQNPKYWHNNLRIVTLLKSNVAFSFFYYVFLGEHIKETDKPAILKHESVHVNQKHTLDLLFFELLRIVFWFNPLIYMYQSRIASLHEFIADAEAIKSQSKNEYYQDLLSQIFETENVSFINAFYKKSLIKKRIVMLSRAKSKQTQLIKYALLIPLVFGMLLYTSSYSQDSTSNIEKVSQEMTDEELRDKYYVEMLDLYSSGKIQELSEFNKSLSIKYLNTKEEYYKFQASMRVLFDKMGDTYSGDKSSFEAKINKTYAEYLEWKKTDEAKEIWENNTYGGVLKMVVANIGSLTDEEQKRYDNLKQMMFKDDNYHSILISDGFNSFKIEETESSKKENDKIIDVKETQIQDQIEVPFAVIEKTPVYPGCENITDTKEQRKCMANKISEFVQKYFNADLARQKQLTGRQRISVVFKIDTLGNITGIRSRAAHPDLETEAERVIGLLPKMQPGKQKGHKVVVPYSLPIVFQVAEGSNDSVEKANSDEKTKYEKSLEELKNYSDKNSVPFALVDKIPLLPSCKNIETKSEQQNCVSDEIIKFTQKNFNTDLAAKLGLKGQNRISIVFIINENGEAMVDKVRAPHPELELEAKRVVELLPKFIPGEHKGKKVNVSYSLPIVFMIK